MVVGTVTGMIGSGIVVGYAMVVAVDVGGEGSSVVVTRGMGVIVTGTFRLVVVIDGGIGMGTVTGTIVPGT